MPICVVGLLAVNFYLCYTLLQKNKSERQLASKNTALTKRSSYMLATYKQALDLDLESGLKEIKVGVYLNLLTCGKCNMETIAFVKKKFELSDLIFFIDDQFKNGVGQLDIKGAEIKFVKNDHFFQSNSPFFFVQARGVNVLKYTHDNNYPDLTVTYIRKIEGYVKSIKNRKVYTGQFVNDHSNVIQISN